MRVCLGLLVLGACGRHQFDVLDATLLPLDAPGPFGSPIPVIELATGGANDDPTLTADMLEIYWESSRAGATGAENLWRARRSSVDDPFGPAESVSELDSPVSDGSPGLSADGLTLAFTSNRGGTLGTDDLFLTTRADRTSPWTTPPVHLAMASSPTRDGAPALSDNGLEIWFHSDRTGGVYDLHVIRRGSVGESFATIAAVRVDLAVARDDQAPFVWGTRRVYFQSDRLPTAGGNDLWVVDYDPSTRAIGDPEPIAELNTIAADDDPWVSPDGNTIYFSRDKVIMKATRE